MQDPQIGVATMTNVRQIVLSIAVLVSFLLVLAAPFRWF
jgi:hypothetical protein